MNYINNYKLIRFLPFIFIIVFNPLVYSQVKKVKVPLVNNSEQLLTDTGKKNQGTQNNITSNIKAFGSGKTRDTARQQALRNAIEEAFGAYISSNTEILNDALIKDEISSVSSGNIQDFSVISEVKMDDGRYETVIMAVVSVTKLSSFVTNKGFKSDFNGSVFAANIKQQLLNEKNEVKSIENITKIGKEILDKSYDFEIVTSDPKICELTKLERNQRKTEESWCIPIEVQVKFNKNIENFTDYLKNSLKGLSMTSDELESYTATGKAAYPLILGDNAGLSSGITDVSVPGGSPYENNSYRHPKAAREKLWEEVSTNNNMRFNVFYGSDLILSTNDFKSARKAKTKIIRRPAHLPAFKKRIHYFDTTAQDPVYYFRDKKSTTLIIKLIRYSIIAAHQGKINRNDLGKWVSYPPLIEMAYILERGQKTYNFGNSQELETTFLVTGQPYNKAGAALLNADLRKFILWEYGGDREYARQNPSSALGKLERQHDSRPWPSTIYYPSVSYSPQGTNQFQRTNNILEFNFLYQIENYIIQKYEAVISLEGFHFTNEVVYRFNLVDELSLSELEKLSGYNIIPTTENAFNDSND